ncbi:hypothetical protein TBR22_A09780 [Luteitalea sp. TBR-22]|uniref:Ig-like domain-containing protein n=1 Tax=Luteitalea sp. TBR-22 TaxID=2802971 RepID=UPI001AF49E14|nr:Ig-like domain-containing protein [Luteitalea sp. TBR-22]BCS31774.1 hypothetical protein TBR22_A09780 [Luteitalea sp. TBR-22]
MKRALLAALALCAALGQASSQLEAQSPAPLNFFKNFFITGDYAVQGIGLRGTGVNGVATGDIVIAPCADGDTERTGCVPRGVDVVAAFLYWQEIADSSDPLSGGRGVTFRGQPLSLPQSADSVEVLFGKNLGLGSPPCWSGGGGTGSGSGQNNLTFTYRADVLRFLDVDPQTGKTAGYGTHRVSLPDTRRASALGASLVVIYRDSSLPYSAIVLYDGTYSMANDTPSMTLPVVGFYDADDVNLAGKLTHIVGSGQANKGETLFYNDTTWLNPLTGSAGPNWDNPTFNVTVDPSRRSIVTGGRPGGTGSFDCLTWAAVVYKTPVNDDDKDGLLNLWETSTTPVVDPYGRELPLLSKMGASATTPDIFLEVNYFKTDTERTYGTEPLPAHSHLPSPQAVRLFGDMFKARGINVHIDLGQDYNVGTETLAEQYLVRDTVAGEGLARGGEWLDEGVTACTPPAGSPPWTCQFGAYPGTIGWKTGLRRVRDSVLVDPPAETPNACDLPGNSCERRFDDVRRDIFRYALFAHHIGIPKSTRPCVNPTTGALLEDVGGACPAGSQRNPDFNVPRTYSGIADFPGGDLIVALGGFKDAQGLPIGTPFMQAATLAHEFGHTAERRHGGEPFEPNCKPGYLSVMNYLYQLRGLVDDNGTPHMDFSDGTPFVTIDESAVQDGVYNTTPYRLGWYAPLDFSYLAGQRHPARSRCDGSPLQNGERMIRIDARASADPIDWNANGTLETATFAQDVNFNGFVNGSDSPTGSAPLKAASDDWSNLKLNQVGSRRNVGGQYRKANGTLAVGALSLSMGKLDLGLTDLGKLDLDAGKLDLDAGKLDLDAGKLDLGKLDLSLGKLDLGKLDLGKLDLDLGAAQEGSGDIGRGDFGGGDLFVNDPENPLGEIDASMAADLARTPPNEFRVCVVGVDAGCAAPGAGPSDVVARFNAPNIGGVAAFKLFRVDGATLTPQARWTQVNVVPADPDKPQDEDYVVIDASELVDGARYTYFAVANYQADAFQGGIDSDPSNLRTITGRNLPLVAGADTYGTDEDTALVVAAPGVLGNDKDEDSPVTLSASLMSGPANGTLVLNANGAFTYTPNPNFSGVDGFTYRPAAGSSVTGTVSITVRSVNDTPTISGLPPQVTIEQGAVAGPIAFTVADAEGAGALSLTGSSSNTALVPNGNIVFGGAGASRTITVTPAAGQAGTATITVRATDPDGLWATAAFALTVNANGAYTFVGLKNAPPPTGATFKAGSAIPMSWRYQRGSTVVDSANLTYTIRFAGPLPLKTQVNTDTGNSNFRYSNSSKSWQFNLQTKDLSTGRGLAPGTYEVTITPNDPRYAPSPTFTVTLVK